jgi:hypothetical protein
MLPCGKSRRGVTRRTPAARWVSLPQLRVPGLLRGRTQRAQQAGFSSMHRVRRAHAACAPATRGCGVARRTSDACSALRASGWAPLRAGQSGRRQLARLKAPRVWLDLDGRLMGLGSWARNGGCSCRRRPMGLGSALRQPKPNAMAAGPRRTAADRSAGSESCAPRFLVPRGAETLSRRSAGVS